MWPNGADFDPATLHDWPAVRGEGDAGSVTLTATESIEVAGSDPRAAHRSSPSDVIPWEEVRRQLRAEE